MPRKRKKLLNEILTLDSLSESSNTGAALYLCCTNGECSGQCCPCAAGTAAEFEAFSFAAAFLSKNSFYVGDIITDGLSITVL